jgi:hypothetical protein
MRDLAAVKAALRQHEIELPSWAFGNTGTRFKVFGQPGVPVACQNSSKAPDLGFYPQWSCLFPSYICSWSGCSAG